MESGIEMLVSDLAIRIAADYQEEYGDYEEYVISSFYADLKELVIMPLGIQIEIVRDSDGIIDFIFFANLN
jgi:hypothetical protein